MIDKKGFKINGYLALLIAIAILIGSGLLLAFIILNFSSLGGLVIPIIVLDSLLFILFFVMTTGFTIIEPNRAKVCTLYGKYVGTINESGFWLVIPLTSKYDISLRVNNFNSDKLKVNDLDGNPIEIATVIVYRVTKPAIAVLNVEDYKEFVHVQCESGIRHIASQYPYDNLNHQDEISLRQHSDEVCEILKSDLEKRFEIAGVEILEARIMHLAYSNEIAAAMLQRQQATAVLAARNTIVLGAVSMVKDAIEQLSSEGVIEFDDAIKAQMVNNLLVSIISEKGTQPVMNNGNGSVA